MISKHIGSKMRFVATQTGSSSERVCILSGFARLPSTSIETPTAALLTRAASVSHMAKDVLSKVFTDAQLLWVPLSSSHQLEIGVKAQGEGVASFASLPQHVSCMTLNDINEVTPPGHFESDTVPLWTRNGKKKISADRYMDIVEVFKPDIFLAIADSRVALSEPHKRISKSVERTCDLLDTCIKRYKGSEKLQRSAFIGVLVGVTHPKTLENCLQRLLLHKDSFAGIALSGLTDGGPDSASITVEQLEPLFKRLDRLLPKHLLRIIEGSWNPSIVLSAIEHGWDVFDGSYPAKLTNAGMAMKFSFQTCGEETEMCILDLGDKRYKEDFSPILTGCDCLVCKKHTRAYINHLLNTRELLAPVLLNMHNLHHFDQLFRYARQHITSNTFQAFKTLITDQYELYRESLPSNKEVPDTDDDTADDAQTNKKKRALSTNGHNLHHFDQLFRYARQHITSNTFQAFKTLITDQYELYRESLPSNKEVPDTDDDTADDAQTNKKKRALSTNGYSEIRNT